MNLLSKLFMISTLAFSMSAFAGANPDDKFEGAPAVVIDEQTPDLSQSLTILNGACRTFGANVTCLLHTTQGYDARIFLTDLRSKPATDVMNYLISRTKALKPIKVEVSRMTANSDWPRSLAVVTRISVTELNAENKAEKTYDTTKLLVSSKGNQFVFSEVQ